MFPIKPARCDEPEVTKKYYFSGKLDQKGRIAGDGVVTIADSLPDQKNCIKIGKSFGLKIKRIRSSFVDGLANSRTFVEFYNNETSSKANDATSSEANDEKSSKAEVVAVAGVVRGLFRFESDDWWSLSTFGDGLVDGPCWTVHSNFVSFI